MKLHWLLFLLSSPWLLAEEPPPLRVMFQTAHPYTDAESPAALEAASATLAQKLGEASRLELFACRDDERGRADWFLHVWCAARTDGLRLEARLLRLPQGNLVARFQIDAEGEPLAADFTPDADWSAAMEEDCAALAAALDALPAPEPRSGRRVVLFPGAVPPDVQNAAPALAALLESALVGACEAALLARTDLVVTIPREVRRHLTAEVLDELDHGKLVGAEVVMDVSVRTDRDDPGALTLDLKLVGMADGRTQRRAQGPLPIDTDADGLDACLRPLVDALFTTD